MDKAEIFQLSGMLHNLYQDRFPVLNSTEAVLWLEALHSTEYLCALAAAQRWYRQHRLRTPSLDELLEQVEFLCDDQRRLAAVHRSLSEPTVVNVSEVLDAAADRTNTEWAHRHVQLFLEAQPSHRLLGESLNTISARLCRQYADECHGDRAAWLAEAAWYDAGAPLNGFRVPKSVDVARPVPGDRQQAAAQDDSAWLTEETGAPYANTIT